MHDPSVFESLEALSEHVGRHGYYGGQRLLLVRAHAGRALSCSCPQRVPSETRAKRCLYMPRKKTPADKHARFLLDRLSRESVGESSARCVLPF